MSTTPYPPARDPEKIPNPSIEDPESGELPEDEEDDDLEEDEPLRA